MNKILFSLLLFVLFQTFSTSGVGRVYAGMVIEPADMAVILGKIAAREAQGPALGRSARIVIKDGRIIFVPQPGSMDVAISFSDKSPTIVKQIDLRNSFNGDGYDFAAMLQNSGRAYQREIKQINGRDALVFFNDTDVFVYTQTAGTNGAIELKEWIYARKPNSTNGSQWSWVFKSALGQWPLTLELGDDGQAVVYRNVPFSGIPITAQARSNYMLSTMVKFTNGDHVEKYFPFHEVVSAIPPSQFWTVEGVQRQADIGISNTSVIDPHAPKPSAEINFFKSWESYWQSVFKVSVTARPEEYPLLIDPSLVIGDKDVK